MIIHYIVPEMWLNTDVIVIFILGYTFPSFTALTAQKIKISKNHKKQQIKQTNKKIPRDIKLHMCTKDYD